MSAMALRTDTLVVSLTAELPCKTKLTVDFDTPACLATSNIVGRSFIRPFYLSRLGTRDCP
jgi:hypothetical protein